MPFRFRRGKRGISSKTDSGSMRPPMTLVMMPIHQLGTYSHTGAIECPTRHGLPLHLRWPPNPANQGQVVARKGSLGRSHRACNPCGMHLIRRSARGAPGGRTMQVPLGWTHEWTSFMTRTDPPPWSRRIGFSAEKREGGSV
jgi:hypothetical protein